MRGFIISLFLLFLTSCSEIKEGAEREVWQVKEVSSAVFPVKKGMTMTLSGDNITFSDKEQSVGYSFLKSNDRLVMKTDTARILFRIRKTSDSTMFFQELYSLIPLNITFTRTTNQ